MRKWYSLMDKVWRLDNLREAYKKVRSNKGAPGIDGETVTEFGDRLGEALDQIHLELRTGRYEPSPVWRVSIDKPDGGQRLLGIPTVKDRVVQQALLQVLEPIFEPDFHPSSYAYRPGRSGQMAVAKAEMFLNRYGLEHVVDMDLSKCFDRLDHALILETVAERVSDGSVLKLIRKFLEAGVMEDGSFRETEVGSPQGGVISPLLANIYLNRFDQAMKEKGIRIVRYADDILVFAESRRQAERYREIATTFLEGDLKLVVNREKTRLTHVGEGVHFLGVVIRRGCISVDPKRIERLKAKIRALTPRNHGGRVEDAVQVLRRLLLGWYNYFRMANCKGLIRELMGWIRRRLRMMQMREWKSWKPLHRALRQRGYRGEFQKISMRRWRNSASPLLSLALPNSHFTELGLPDLEALPVALLEQYRTA